VEKRERERKKRRKFGGDIAVLWVSESESVGGEVWKCGGIGGGLWVSEIRSWAVCVVFKDSA
jgi:hypothetical protein